MAQTGNSQAPSVFALANRLRLLQVDLADQDDSTRTVHLADEIDRTLNKLPLSERPTFLRDLAGHFPTWDAEVDAGRRDSDRSTFDERELNDPAFLVTRLIEVCGRLPNEQRQAVIDQLDRAGLAAAGAPAWPESAAGEMRTKLQCVPNSEIDPLRVLQLVTILGEFVCSLDQMVWNTWREISPASRVQRPQALRKRLAKFISAAPDTPRPEIEHDVNKVRQLSAALVAALPRSWTVAVDRFRALWPEQIQSAAGKGGIFGGDEARYWRKYVELAGSKDPSSVEDEIRQAIAEVAESLMRAPKTGMQ